MLIPVGPVNPVFENGDCKGVADSGAGCEHYSTIRSVIVATGDEIHFGVDPKKPPVGAVERDSIRPLDVRVDEYLPMRAVHSGALDSRRSAPVGPVQPAFNWVDSDGSGLLEPVGQQRLAKCALQIGDLDRILGRIGPVQVPINPIDRQSIGIDNVAEGDHCFALAFVNRRLVDALVDDVTPVEHAALEVEVERRRAARLVHDRRQIAAVEREAPDVRSVREKQSRVAFVSFAARSIVRITRVAGQTLALEAALLIDARLRTCSRLQTFVHIFTEENSF